MSEIELSNKKTNWTHNDEEFLLKIHKECNVLIELYRNEYLYNNKRLCFYKIPTIIISSLSGFLSVSNTGYTPKHLEKYISLIVGLLNLLVSTINVIEQFKGINNKVTLSIRLYHELIQLSNDISLTLTLDISERNYKNGIECVSKYYERFSTILKDTNILKNSYQNYLELNEINKNKI